MCLRSAFCRLPSLLRSLALEPEVTENKGAELTRELKYEDLAAVRESLATIDPRGVGVVLPLVRSQRNNSLLLE